MDISSEVSWIRGAGVDELEWTNHGLVFIFLMFICG